MTSQPEAASREIRQLRGGELDVCLALSRRADPHSWSAANWKHSLQNDHCLGVFRDRVMVAVAAFSLVLDEVSLLNVVVDRDCRGQGLARLLLEAGLEWMQQFGGDHCVLEVRESNEAARSLYRKMGFREDGLRKNYYPLDQGREHAVLMSADLPLDN